MQSSSKAFPANEDPGSHYRTGQRQEMVWKVFEERRCDIPQNELAYPERDSFLLD